MVIKETPKQQIDVDVVYKKDGDLWVLSFSGESKQITFTSGSIVRFTHNFGSNIVAFVKGEKVKYESGSDGIEPEVASFYNLKNGEIKDIYQLEYSVVDNSEYAIYVSDVGVSTDDTMIAVTTNDKILLYSMSSRELSTIFTVGSETKKDVFSIRGPVFSPDKSKILFSKGYYEGSSSAWVDVANGAVIDLPYMSYVTGKRVVGWKDDNNLYVLDYNSRVNAADNEDVVSKITVASLSSPENLVDVISVEGTPWGDILHNDKLYSIVSDHKPRQGKSESYGEYTYYENYTAIYEFDLKRRVKSELYKAKERNEETQVETYYHGVRISHDAKKLYIEGSVREESSKTVNKIFVMDLQAPVRPKEILMDASF